MTKAISGKTLLSKHVGKNDRILLVNPPVYETRYSWVKWNQPLDLLQVARYLDVKRKCQRVELFDFMLPNRDGRVQKQGLAGPQRYHEVGLREFAYTYPMWRFGQPLDALGEWLTARRAGNRLGEPTQVWITSLCSYWFSSIHQLCTKVRRWLPEAKIVIMGSYPKYMLENVMDFCDADYAVNSDFGFANEGTSLDLYGESKPEFLAVPLNANTAVSSIQEAIEYGVTRVTIFDNEDNLCRQNGEVLIELIEKTKSLHPHLRYHLICGLHPQHVTKRLATLFSQKCIVELHFEQCDKTSGLDTKSYLRCTELLREAGINLSTGDKTSGFVWIGRANETLEGIVENVFTVLSSFGSVILKPYSPVPGTQEWESHRDYLESIRYEDLSPHRFPFAELNQITRDEYHDLYRMAAFLNEKVKNKSFDMFGSSLGAELLRNSLRREAWKLNGSALRIID